MIIRRLEDFVIWQLSTELEHQVYAFTSRSPAKGDVDFCRDIRRSAASAPRNISEGYGRFYPTEFAPKLRIARGELQETHDHLLKAVRERYLSEDEARPMLVLARRALGGATRLLAYFDRQGNSWKKDFLARQLGQETALPEEPSRQEPPRQEPPQQEPPPEEPPREEPPREEPP